MLPLLTADLLAHAIVGSVLENLDMERLIHEVGHAVAQRILGNNESVDDVAKELHEKLLLRNESTKKVVIESIYKESEEAKHNVRVFTEAPSLAEARPLLKRVSLRFGPFGFIANRQLYRSMEHASPTSICKHGMPSIALPMLLTRRCPHLRPHDCLHLRRKFHHHHHHVKLLPISPRLVPRRQRAFSAQPLQLHRFLLQAARLRLVACVLALEGVRLMMTRTRTIA